MRSPKEPSRNQTQLRSGLWTSAETVRLHTSQLNPNFCCCNVKEDTEWKCMRRKKEPHREKPTVNAAEPWQGRGSSPQRCTCFSVPMKGSPLSGSASLPHHVLCWGRSPAYILDLCHHEMRILPHWWVGNFLITNGENRTFPRRNLNAGVFLFFF